MKIKSVLIVVLTLLCVFITYYLKSMGDGLQKINEDAFILDAFEVSKKNIWSKFEINKHGPFNIHTGKKTPIKGVFTFNENGNLLLGFFN
jgi:hypothetical protein